MAEQTTRQQDQASQSAYRQRTAALKQSVLKQQGVGAGVAGFTRQTFSQAVAVFRNLDGVTGFFVGVAVIKDVVDFFLSLITADAIHLLDWIVDVPLLVLFIFVGIFLVLSNPTSTASLVTAFVGPVVAGVGEISPLGILPFWSGFAITIVATIQSAQQQSKLQKLKDIKNLKSTVKQGQAEREELANAA